MMRTGNERQTLVIYCNIITISFTTTICVLLIHSIVFCLILIIMLFFPFLLYYCTYN